MSATHPSPSGAPPSESAAFAEAQAEFAWLVKEIRAAQEVGDLAAVRTARHLAGPIYGRHLSPEDRATHGKGGFRVEERWVSGSRGRRSPA